MSNGRFSGINQRIADRLLAEGRIKREDHQRAVEYATRQKSRIEEALIELEIFTEIDLLKFIATVHNTRYVSTDKLSKAVIEPRVLGRVAVRTAELHGVFPVLYDEKANSLSVVTADPDNDAALHEVKLAAQVKEVRALAARPVAVRAAIAYHYRSDRSAFQPLVRPVGGFELAGHDPFERRGLAPTPLPSSTTASPPAVVQAAQAPTSHPPAPAQRWTQPTAAAQPSWGPQPPPPGWQPSYPQGVPPFAMSPQWGPQPWGPTQPPPGWQPGPQGWSPQAMASQHSSSTLPPQAVGSTDPAPPPSHPGRVSFPRNRSLTPTKTEQFLAPPASLVAMVPPQATFPQPLPQPPSSSRGVWGAGQSSASPPPSSPSSKTLVAVLPPAVSSPIIETLNVLISLLENARPDLRGHSSMVARLTRKTCERIGLSSLQTAAFSAAAYLHDLGKMGAYHLTALNVAEYEGHRAAASKSADLPVHLMESVGLLPETLSAISSMYERYDGQGIPNGQAGKDIPLGARIIAVADTYADLTQNPRNPYRKILRPFEACEVLLQYRSTVFDPNIVDIFRHSTTGEDMRAKLLSDRQEALIVDPDPEETTVLELRLIEQGFEVKIARTAAQARKVLADNEIDAVVCEIDLDTPDAGLTLRDALLKEGVARNLTWVVLTSKTDRQAAQRAFDQGVDDFVLKPVSADIFAAKLRQLIERRATKDGAGARGVTGSLTEMSLPDMVQILWHGRKTCALRITSGQSAGEIDFGEGQVVDARWDSLRGEDAFYKMLTLREGDFRLDPTFKPNLSARTIQASPEALLLEGMRRLDEASV